MESSIQTIRAVGSQPQADRREGAIQPPSRRDLCRPASRAKSSAGVWGHPCRGRRLPAALPGLGQLSAISRGTAWFRGHKPDLPHGHRADDPIQQKERHIMIDTKPTTNRHAPPSSGVNLQRKTSLAAGVLYLLTFVSIPTLALYGPVRGANYILGAGPDTGALVGAILEIIVALAGIGTAAALYPVLKRQNEGVAMGFVGSRTLEASGLFAGVMCVLSVVSLRQAGAGAESLVTSHALVTMYDRIFLISGGFIPAVNGVLLGFLLYRSRLVPRVLPLLGFIGATVLVAADLAVLFDLIGRTSTPALVTALPIALWEFSLGVWLVVKGFKPSAITALYSRTAGVDNGSLAPGAAAR